MKRIIATLVLCLTIATVVGCGSGSATPSKATPAATGSTPTKAP